MMLMRMALIFLFLSISASADVLDSCIRATGILLNKAAHYLSPPFTPKTFFLKRKIMRRFSQLGGYRIHSIVKHYGLSNDNYLKGLGNLNFALENADPIWNKVKLKAIFIGDTTNTLVHLDLFGLCVISIRYNEEAHSIPLKLSAGLLGFGIKDKLKKDCPFPIKSKGLTGEQYKNALEAFYNALEKGPIPKELKKLRGITIIKEGSISYAWSFLPGEDMPRPVLNIPAHIVSDLERVAIGVLESQVAEKMAEDYAYSGYSINIDNAIVNDGVERQTYREVLEKMIEKLTEGSIAKENLRPEDPDPLDLRNLARIHITKVGEVSTRQRGDGLFDLYLPADVILDDIPITVNFSRLLLPAP